MKLSIVATLYQSAAHIIEFYQRASDCAQKLVGDDYEIILVNDGSPDNSLELAVSLTKTDQNLIVVDLSRNFGHHKAMMTGLAQAKGDFIFLIDSDLEEKPEWLPAFYKKMAEEECDVVYGVQEKRRGGLFERWSGQLFYCIFKLAAGITLSKNLVTARLMTRRYVDPLLLHKEREVFMAGLLHITGFKQISYNVQKQSLSKTTYTFQKKFSLLVNAITSFSNRPLIAIFNIGAFISFASILYIIYLISHWLLVSESISGWTSVMASIWLLGGMIISFIGVIGIYLSKIFSETKQRPYTIIKQIYGEKFFHSLSEKAASKVTDRTKL